MRRRRPAWPAPAALALAACLSWTGAAPAVAATAEPAQPPAGASAPQPAAANAAPEPAAVAPEAPTAPPAAAPEPGGAPPAPAEATAAPPEPGAAPASPAAHPEPGAAPASPPAPPEPGAAPPAPAAPSAASPEPGAAAPPAPPAEGNSPPQQADDSYLTAPQPVTNDPVGSRLIDVATPFTVGRQRIELLVTHRFNQPVNHGGTWHNLFGLDSGADVGVGFTYGLLRRLDLSAYRSQFQEDYELAAKLQLLQPSRRLPLSVAVRAGADLLGRRGVSEPHRPFAQALLAGRLAAGWNVFVSPSWVRATPLLRNAWNVPVGVTAPLPGRWLLDGEVIAPNHALHRMPGASTFAWHAAFTKGVGWHIFQIVLGNSRASTVDQMIGGDFAGGFTTHDVRLGFNLIRYFKL